MDEITEFTIITCPPRDIQSVISEYVDYAALFGPEPQVLLYSITEKTKTSFLVLGWKRSPIPAEFLQKLREDKGIDDFTTHKVLHEDESKQRQEQGGYNALPFLGSGGSADGQAQLTE